MPLLTATSTFRLGRRRWSSQQCCLHYLHTANVTRNFRKIIWFFTKPFLGIFTDETVIIPVMSRVLINMIMLFDAQMWRMWSSLSTTTSRTVPRTTCIVLVVQAVRQTLAPHTRSSLMPTATRHVTWSEFCRKPSRRSTPSCWHSRACPPSVDQAEVSGSHW